MSKIKIASKKKKNDLEGGIGKDNVNMALIHEVLKQIRIIMQYKENKNWNNLKRFRRNEA